jgi:hypothetical protein
MAIFAENCPVFSKKHLVLLKNHSFYKSAYSVMPPRSSPGPRENNAPLFLFIVRFPILSEVRIRKFYLAVQICSGIMARTENAMLLLAIRLAAGIQTRGF